MNLLNPKLGCCPVYVGTYSSMFGLRLCVSTGCCLTDSGSPQKEGFLLAIDDFGSASGLMGRVLNSKQHKRSHSAGLGHDKLKSLFYSYKRLEMPPPLGMCPIHRHVAIERVSRVLSLNPPTCPSDMSSWKRAVFPPLNPRNCPYGGENTRDRCPIHRHVAVKRVGFCSSINRHVPSDRSS